MKKGEEPIRSSPVGQRYYINNRFARRVKNENVRKLVARSAESKHFGIGRSADFVGPLCFSPHEYFEKYAARLIFTGETRTFALFIRRDQYLNRPGTRYRIKTFDDHEKTLPDIFLFIRRKRRFPANNGEQYARTGRQNLFQKLQSARLYAAGRHEGRQPAHQ